MIEIRQLHYIVTTAELGSFSQAALALRMKQSTLSQRVRHLENRLGVDLFDRSTKGARLTDVGTQFLIGAKQLIADLEQLHKDASAYRTGAWGNLNVGLSGAVSSELTQNIFLNFSRSHPCICMSAVTTDRKTLSTRLSSGRFDAIFLTGHLAPEGASYRSIGSDRLFAVAHRESAIAGAQQVYWADLRDKVILMPAGPVGEDLSGQIVSRLPFLCGDPAFSRRPLRYDALCQLIGPESCTVIGEKLSRQIPESHVLVAIHEAHGHARLDYGVCWLPDSANPALRHLLTVIEEIS